MSDTPFKEGTHAHRRLAQAMGTLVELALPHADNIDEGYFYEADLVAGGTPIGCYRVTVQRVAKP